MSEKNNIFENDLLMRTILESGQEEVPGRVWDAVSDRLDEAAGKKSKTVALWWRRAGVAVAAVAAAVAAVVLIDKGEEAVELVPRAVQGDMIAVVETEAVVNEETVISQTSSAELLAYAPGKSAESNEYINQFIIPSEEVAETEDIARAEIEIEDPTEVTTNGKADIPSKEDEVNAKSSDAAIWQSYDWEDETPARQVKTSFVLSGITGASSSQSSTSAGPLKAPAVVLAPAETGIKEKENQTRYGIPVSVGAGVRFELTPRWSLGVGLNYTNLSRTLQGTYTHVNEAGSIDNLVTSEIKNNQHFIGIPVNVYFNILNNESVSFYAYAGGAVEKCIADKYHVLTNNIMHREAVKGVQVSAAAGFGVEFAFNQYLGLYIDPSLRYYFDCDQPKSIRTAQPLMLSAEVGLRFRL